MPIPTDAVTGEQILSVDDSAGQVSTASISTINASAASQQLLAANTSRRGLALQNTDPQYGVYVKYGATATSTSFTAYIGPMGYWEMPHPIYAGRIDAIWAAAGTGKL